MLENLLNLVKDNAGPLLTNPAIPADRQQEAITAAATSISNGLQTSLTSGGVTEVLDLFKGNTGDLASHPVTQQVSSTFVEDMSSKFGISSLQAGSIASALIPTVLGKLISKTNDPADNTFNIQHIFNQLTSGKTSGLNLSSILANFKSRLDADKDGDLDLQDLKSIVSEEGKNVVDKIKGLFK